MSVNERTERATKKIRNHGPEKEDHDTTNSAEVRASLLQHLPQTQIFEVQNFGSKFKLQNIIFSFFAPASLRVQRRRLSACLPAQKQGKTRQEVVAMSTAQKQGKTRQEVVAMSTTPCRKKKDSPTNPLPETTEQTA